MNDKKLIALLLAGAFFFSASASAQQLPPQIPLPPIAASQPDTVLGASFTFGIRIQEFARVVLNDVLRVPFVFSSDFLDSGAKVGFSAKDLKKTGTEALLRDVLDEHGFTLEKRGGYYRVYSKKESIDKESDKIDYFYRLKHRDLAYVTNRLEGLFPSSSLTNKRKFDAPEQKGVKPRDDGNSLYSMTTKGDGDLLIFRGTPEQVKRLETVLKEIDTPISKVLVRAMLIEVSKKDSKGYSVSAVAKLLNAKLGLTLSASASANQLTFNTPDFSAVASALQNDNAVNVTTAPAVIAKTGSTGKVMVGDTVPTLGAIQYDNNGASRQSVEKVDTGVILNFTPEVLAETITLTVTHEISDAVQTQTGVQGSPTITKRSLDTVLTMTDKDVVILGGLSSVKSVNSRDRLPFLPFFNLSDTTQSSQTDIVVLLYVERV